MNCKQVLGVTGMTAFAGLINFANFGGFDQDMFDHGSHDHYMRAGLLAVLATAAQATLTACIFLAGRKLVHLAEKDKIHEKMNRFVEGLTEQIKQSARLSEI